MTIIYNQKIIDLGCATGNITFYIYNKLKNCDLIIGTDIDNWNRY